MPTPPRRCRPRRPPRSRPRPRACRERRDVPPRGRRRERSAAVGPPPDPATRSRHLGRRQRCQASTDCQSTVNSSCVGTPANRRPLDRRHVQHEPLVATFADERLGVRQVGRSVRTTKVAANDHAPRATAVGADLVDLERGRAFVVSQRCLGRRSEHDTVPRAVVNEAVVHRKRQRIAVIDDAQPTDRVRVEQRDAFVNGNVVTGR